VRIGFGSRLRHPFFPALRLTPAADVRHEASALCGGFTELCRAASRGARVERAVFPLLPSADPVLTVAQRDLLWRLFRVPVYALLLDGYGRVAGYECEAQQGIHVVENYCPGSDFTLIEQGMCECGRPGARLVPAESVEDAAESALLAG
jgi:hypothetical protein